MRIYLVVMDETEEAKKALRFASVRARETGGSVHILALVPLQNFNAFGGVQATIEREAQEKIKTRAGLSAPGCRKRESSPSLPVSNSKDQLLAQTIGEQ